LGLYGRLQGGRVKPSISPRKGLIIYGILHAPIMEGNKHPLLNSHPEICPKYNASFKKA
jgi:hypothetical protein